MARARVSRAAQHYRSRSTPPIPAMPLDIVPTTNCKVACSTARKLRAAYSGQLMQVREASADVVTGIGFQGRRPNKTAMAAHCLTNDGTIAAAFYDQGPGGNHFGQTTQADQPQIYDGATGPLLRDHFLCPTFTENATHLERNDAFGLVSSEAIDAFIVFGFDVLPSQGRILYVGGLGLNERLEIRVRSDGTTRASFGDGRREFTSIVDYSAGLSLLHMRAELGAQYGEWRCWSNLTELAESAVVNPTAVLNFDDDLSLIQSTVEDAGICEVLLFASASDANALTDADAALLRADIVNHYGLV